MKHYILPILAAILALLPSCIEDGFTTSPSDQPTFSVDTLKMGDVYTLEGTPTHRFVVYNRHSKMLSISSISLADDPDSRFRLNVDGLSGRSFSNVEIRPNDSIFVFVEATLAENGIETAQEIFRKIEFVTNGVSSTVVVSITGQDANRCDAMEITSDATFTAGRPYLISDTLRVAPGATLTVEPGARLRFREKAALKVEGRLIVNGTPEQPVEMIGHRDGFVAGSIPYELMSGQWGGIYFTETSTGNVISFASIRNSSDGLTLAPQPEGDTSLKLRLTDSQVRNTTNYVVDAAHCNTLIAGCELTEASNGILRLIGGSHDVNHCTIANYYLFTALGAPSVTFGHTSADDAEEGSERPYISAEISNSIIYGLGTLLSHGDLTGTDIFIRNTLLGVAGSDDDNFLGCIWDEDPLFYTVRLDYLFDYRLKPDSPAIGAADTDLDRFGLTVDRFGNTLTTDLGAYTYIAPDGEDQ